MNRQCAAVLLAAGWYLLAPPSRDAGLSTPLGQWTHLGATDTATACEERQEASLRRLKEARRQPGVSREDLNLNTAMTWNYAQSRCIATDDPRLR